MVSVLKVISVEKVIDQLMKQNVSRMFCQSWRRGDVECFQSRIDLELGGLTKGYSHTTRD